MIDKAQLEQIPILRYGGTLVLTAGEYWSQEEMSQVSAEIKTAMPGINTIVLPFEMKVLGIQPKPESHDSGNAS